MTTKAHFKPSVIGDIHRMSMVEARYHTLTGVQNRPGTTGATPGGRQTIDAYNSWYHETHDRPKDLAPGIRRAQSNLGADYKPIRGSDTHGVQASSNVPDVSMSVRGIRSTPMSRQDSTEMPDKRDSFGHNLKNRFNRVRGND